MHKKLAAAVSCVAGLPVAAQAQTYTLADLEQLGGVSSWTYSSSKVLVEGGGVPADVNNGVLILADGTVVDLGGVRSFGGLAASAGQVVGGSASASAGYGTLLEDDGTVVKGETLGGSASYSGAINELGRIVGGGFAAGGGAAGAGGGASGAGAMPGLGALDSPSSAAAGMGGLAQIGGASGAASGQPGAVFYSNGTGAHVAMLGSAFSVAGPVNNAGQGVAVGALTGDMIRTAFVSSSAAPANIGVPVASNSYVPVIPSVAQIVGGTKATASVSSPALLFIEGRATGLGLMIGAPAARQPSSGGPGNPLGQITDWGMSPAVVTARPPAPAPAVASVPEPATWLMLLGGFGFIGGALRHARRGRAAIRFA